MTQCREAKYVPANSIQSTGFIKFSDGALHVFSGPVDGGLHLIIPHARGGECALIALAAFFFFDAQNSAQVELFQHVKPVYWDKGKRICIM